MLGLINKHMRCLCVGLGYLGKGCKTSTSLLLLIRSVSPWISESRIRPHGSGVIAGCHHELLQVDPKVWNLVHRKVLICTVYSNV